MPSNSKGEVCYIYQQVLEYEFLAFYYRQLLFQIF